MARKAWTPVRWWRLAPWDLRGLDLESHLRGLLAHAQRRFDAYCIASEYAKQRGPYR